jgi:hypothetical protein
MANEIGHNYPAGATLYACRYKLDGTVFLTDGSVAETWGDSGHDADDYDVAMTDKGNGHYVGTFDASGNIDTGSYRVCLFLQAGAAPDDSDRKIAQGVMHWDKTTTSVITIKFALTAILAAIAAVSALIVALQSDVTDIKAMTDLIAVVTTTVADANDPNTFTLTAGIDVNDAYAYNVVMVEDADDSHREIRYIADWLSTRVLVVDHPFTFTPAVSDNVWIMGTDYGGYLYQLLFNTQAASAPIYYFHETPASGATEGAGGTTYFYDQSGADP